MPERLGYGPVTRTSSPEALALFRERPDNFDLVITDMTMPHLIGDMLARQLISLRPDIPIIICTGYSELLTEEKARSPGVKAFIMKPVLMKDLAKTIRKVLNGAKA